MPGFGPSDANRGNEPCSVVCSPPTRSTFIDFVVGVISLSARLEIDTNSLRKMTQKLTTSAAARVTKEA